MKKTLFLSVIFQILVLFSLLLFAYLPLYFGTKIQVRATGYDPRDMFLGNYTSLSYNIQTIFTKESYKPNKIVYLKLKKVDSLYEGDFLSYSKPKQGFYIKGRVNYSYKKNNETLYKTNIRFGIESYYTTTQNAQMLEKKLLEKNATITLGVLYGIARIEKLEFEK